MTATDIIINTRQEECHSHLSFNDGKAYYRSYFVCNPHTEKKQRLPRSVKRKKSPKISHITVLPVGGQKWAITYTPYNDNKPRKGKVDVHRESADNKSKGF